MTGVDNFSLAQRLSWLSEAERKKALDGINPDHLLHDWSFWARPNQMAPQGNWSTWLYMAGRGAGKTKTAAEWIHDRVKKGLARQILLLGRTSADVRDVMIFGPSGLMNSGHPADRPEFYPSKRLVEWPNGAQALVFSAEEPDQLRGPQGDTAWADEFASFPSVTGVDGLTAFDNLRLGLRLPVPSDRPRMILTTTPRRVPAMFKILEDAKDPKYGITITRGTTYENLGNLAEEFRATILGLYEGTRVGQQELLGEMLEDVEGAIFQQELFDDNRVKAALAGRAYTVVAVDPSVAERPKDECGIVVVQSTMERDYYRRQLYVVEDNSILGPPSVWAARVAESARRWNCPIVAEGNQGGELVRMAIAQVDSNLPVHIVHATAGKRTRAEPVAAIAQQGRLHMVGWYPELEAQACLVAGTLIQTDRGQVPIEDVTARDRVWTRLGWAPVDWAGKTMDASLLTTVTHSGGAIRCTRWHRIWTQNRGFVPAALVQPSDLLVVSASAMPAATASPTVAAGTRRWTTATTEGSSDCCTVSCGAITTGPSPMGSSSTTSTMIRPTTGPTTSLPFPPTSMDATMWRMIEEDSSGGRLMNALLAPSACGASVSPVLSVATTAARSTPAPTCGHGGAVGDAGGSTGGTEPVYDIKVADGHLHEFFANGILVHNTQWVPGETKDSPDRLDALVWAVISLTTRQKGVTFTIGRHLRARATRSRLPTLNADLLTRRGSGR